MGNRLKLLFNSEHAPIGAGLVVWIGVSVLERQLVELTYRPFFLPWTKV